MIGANKIDSLETKIAAARPISLTASTIYNADFVDLMFIGSPSGKAEYSKVAWTCAIRVDFTPLPGRNYEMVYDFARNRCDVLVNSIEVKDGNSTKVPVEVKTSPASCGTALRGN